MKKANEGLYDGHGRYGSKNNLQLFMLPIRTYASTSLKEEQTLDWNEYINGCSKTFSFIARNCKRQGK